MTEVLVLDVRDAPAGWYKMRWICGCDGEPVVIAVGVGVRTWGRLTGTYGTKSKGLSHVTF